MLPHKHAAISVGVGAVGWLATGEPLAGAAALATGILPDVDHAVDYAIYYWQRRHRLVLPLHGYEYAIIGAMAAATASNSLGSNSTISNILWIGTLSYFIHLLADQAENRTHPLGYSLLFRIWHRFRLEEISTVPEDAARGRMDDIQMLLRLWTRLTQRLTHRS